MDEKTLSLITTLIPLVTSYVKKVFAEKGTLPTDDEVLAELNSEENKVLITSSTYLTDNPPTNPPA